MAAKRLLPVALAGLTLLHLSQPPEFVETKIDDVFNLPRNRSEMFRNEKNRVRIDDLTEEMTQPIDEMIRNGTGAFIHVGKTGGSSLTGFLRNACHFFVPKPCSIIRNETTVSRRIDHYYHVVDFDKFHESNDTRFLISLRDAYERTISAFSYHHPRNVMHYRPRLMRGKMERQVAPRAYQTCFPYSLDTFAKLSWTFDGNETCNYRPTEDPFNVDDRDCAALACAAARGEIRFYHHLYFNYQFINKVLFHDDPDREGTKRREFDLYAIRQEQLWEDWRKVNLLWGEPESYQSPKRAKVLRNVTSLNLPIHKGQVTEEGRSHLCRAIEPEYRAYFRLLRESVNLRTEKRAISDARELARKYCPVISDWALLLDDEK